MSDGKASLPAPLPAETEAQPLSPALRDLAETAREYASARSSANTQRAYASDWKLSPAGAEERLCGEREPNPQAVGLFLAASADGKDMAAVAVATIERRLAAITTQYRSAGAPLPRQDRHIVDVMAGIRRKHAKPRSRRRRSSPKTSSPCAPRSTKTCAAIATGPFCSSALPAASGARRSWARSWPEPIGRRARLDRDPPRGSILSINGKTGWRQVEIARGSSERSCPVVALERWISLAKLKRGPLFRPMLRANAGIEHARLTDRHVAGS